MLWVVYATRSRIIRRVIVPDPGMRPSDHVGEGESIAIVSDPGKAESMLPKGAAGPDMDVIAEEIESITSLAPLNSRCAVIDADGNVSAVISADPDLDHVPGYTLVLHDEAAPGWKRVGGRFEKPPEPEEVAEEVLKAEDAIPKNKLGG